MQLSDGVLQDAADVLNVATSNTLVLVDELGKSTSSTDGIAFAWAMAEELLARKCLTMFATHFKELERLSKVYAGATSMHMEALDDNAQYRQTHKCLSGPCTEVQYGLKLAQKVRQS
jgi:DNA mismatch repair protein MutS